MPPIEEKGCQTELWQAVMKNDPSAVERLLERPGIVSAVNKPRQGHSFTPLQYACQKGYTAVVRQLLRINGILVDTPSADPHGRQLTALILAAGAGHEAVVKELLLSKKADVNKASSDGSTALMHAAGNGHTVVIQHLLLSTGILPNQTNKQGANALMLAAFAGQERAVRQLLSTPDTDVNQADKDGSTALLAAVTNGHERVVARLLASEGIDANKINPTLTSPLGMASILGHQAIVNLLLQDKNLDVEQLDQTGSTPLMLASLHGHSAVVRRLVDSGRCDINRELGGSTPLMVASAQGHEPVVKELLASPGIQVKSALRMAAATTGSPSIICLLLQSPEADSAVSQQAFILACRAGNEAVLQAFLESGKVDASQPSSDGEVAVAVAAECGHRASVLYLLSVTETKDARTDGHAAVALHRAIANGHDTVVNVLLDYKSSS